MMQVHVEIQKHGSYQYYSNHMIPFETNSNWIQQSDKRPYKKKKHMLYNLF